MGEIHSSDEQSVDASQNRILQKPATQNKGKFSFRLPSFLTTASPREGLQWLANKGKGVGKNSPPKTTDLSDIGKTQGEDTSKKILLSPLPDGAGSYIENANTEGQKIPDENFLEYLHERAKVRQTRDTDVSIHSSDESQKTTKEDSSETYKLPEQAYKAIVEKAKKTFVIPDPEVKVRELADEVLRVRQQTPPFEKRVFTRQDKMRHSLLLSEARVRGAKDIKQLEALITLFESDISETSVVREKKYSPDISQAEQQKIEQQEKERGHSIDFHESWDGKHMIGRVKKTSPINITRAELPALIGLANAPHTLEALTLMKKDHHRSELGIDRKKIQDPQLSQRLQSFGQNKNSDQALRLVSKLDRWRPGWSEYRSSESILALENLANNTEVFDGLTDEMIEKINMLSQATSKSIDTKDIPGYVDIVRNPAKYSLVTHLIASNSFPIGESAYTYTPLFEDIDMLVTSGLDKSLITLCQAGIKPPYPFRTFETTMGGEIKSLPVDSENPSIQEQLQAGPIKAFLEDDQVQEYVQVLQTLSPNYITGTHQLAQVMPYFEKRKEIVGMLGFMMPSEVTSYDSMSHNLKTAFALADQRPDLFAVVTSEEYVAYLNCLQRNGFSSSSDDFALIYSNTSRREELSDVSGKMKTYQNESLRRIVTSDVIAQLREVLPHETFHLNQAERYQNALETYWNPDFIQIRTILRTGVKISIDDLGGYAKVLENSDIWRVLSIVEESGINADELGITKPFQIEKLVASPLLQTEVVTKIPQYQRAEWLKYATRYPQSLQEYIYADIKDVEALTPELLTKTRTLYEIDSLISSSPSQEIGRIRPQLLDLLWQTTNPNEAFEKIQSVFVKNNLPLVGKVFQVFEILYPGDKINTVLEEIKYPPVLVSLEGNKDARRYGIIYRDLLKAQIGSGNRSLRDFTTFLDTGIPIFDRIMAGEQIGEDEQRRATIAIKKLQTMQQRSSFGGNILPAAQDEEGGGSLQAEIAGLRMSLGVKENQTMQARVEEIFVGPLRHIYSELGGVHTLSDVSRVMKEIKNTAQKENIFLFEDAKLQDGERVVGLDPGDLIKHVNESNIDFIFDGGILSREYLGGNADSDLTPFGTDCTMVTEDDAKEGFAIAYSRSGKSFGDIALVIKDRGQFQHTVPGESATYEQGKYEVYRTGVVDAVRHMDIRTGLPSTEINYIVVADAEKIDKLSFSIAKQGVYIPIVDQKGKVVFTPEQYYSYRSAFDGVGEYDGKPLHVVPTTERDLHYDAIQELLPQIRQDIDVVDQLSKVVREKIEAVIKKRSIELADDYDMDITHGLLVDTGSSGRHTNVPGDYDFDLMLLLDAQKVKDAASIGEELIEILDPAENKSHGDANGVGFQVRSIGSQNIITGEKIDVDVGITSKASAREFATNDAISAKLNWIKQHKGEEVYHQVLANIVLAKKMLKESNVYKKDQGGFGGVGTETWLLAHGGNVHRAFESFWEAAHHNGQIVSIEEFRKRYKILDVGVNLKFKSHDNYADVLKDDGYKNMLTMIGSYLGKGPSVSAA